MTERVLDPSSSEMRALIVFSMTLIDADPARARPLPPVLTPTPTATATIVESEPLVMSIGPDTRSVDDRTAAIVEVRISLTPIAAPRPLPAETAIPPPIEMIDEPSDASTETATGGVAGSVALCDRRRQDRREGVPEDEIDRDHAGPGDARR